MKSVYLLSALASVLLYANCTASVADAYIDPYDTEFFRIRCLGNSNYLHADAPPATVLYSRNHDIRDLASHWYLEPSPDPSQFWIRHRITGASLHTVGGSAEIQAGSLSVGDPAHRWILTAGKNFFRIRNVAQADQYLTTGTADSGPLVHAPLDLSNSRQQIILESLPQGAIMPWLSYDEDNFDTLVDPAEVVRTSYDENFAPFSPAAESQKLACVILNGFGTRITWTVRESANAATIRYSLQDGDSGTVTLTIEPVSGGAARVIKVPVTSAQAWVYFDEGEEYDTDAPGRIPGKRFAEARVLLDTPVEPGDLISLSRENGDALIWIDVMELETATEYIPAVASEYLNVTDSPWNAVGDGIANDYFAIVNCMNAAVSSGKKVYLPAGRYNIPFELIIPQGIHLQGAGMWHTEIFFSGSGSQTSGGIRADGSGQVLRDLYIKGSQTTRNGGYKGIKGNWGTGSLIENVWVEDTETGMWIADFYGSSLGITDGLVVRNSRFRNTFADGINMSSGTRNTIVENCHFRGTGDDALATWAAGRKENLGPTFNQKFRYNTIECGYRAGGIGVFGGGAHEIHHNVVRDQYIGAGIRLNTVFIWLDFNGPQGYPFNATGDPIRIYDNTLIRTGARSLFGEEVAALDMVTRDTDVENMVFENIDIGQSQFSGIRFHGNGTLANPLPRFGNVRLRNVRMLEVPVGTRATGLALGDATFIDVKPIEPAVTDIQLKNGFSLDQSTTLDAWINQHFSDPGSPEAGLGEDPNRNGIENLFEFVYGLNPTQSNGQGFPINRMEIVRDNGGNPALEMTFTSRDGHILGDFETGFMIDGVTLIPETSQTLGSGSAWLSGEALFAQSGSIITLDGQTRQTTIRLKLPLDSTRFVRQRAAAN